MGGNAARDARRAAERRPALTLIDRIDKKVDRLLGLGACWPWTGNTGQWGQPTISLGKYHTGSPRALGWEHIHGPVPQGRAVGVTCGRPGCMNPEHWELRAHGDDVARFWEKTRKAAGDACWEWTGSLAKHGGYAEMKSGGKKIRASRFAYEIDHGKPIGDPLLFVCHKCDNPKCVRADHLFLGTALDNHLDMQAKGRMSKGAKHAALIRNARERKITTSAQSKGEP